MREVRFSVHKTVIFFFSADVPVRSPRRHVLMSVLPKVITGEAEKPYSSDLPCVWGHVRIYLDYGFQSFWLCFFKLKF